MMRKSFYVLLILTAILLCLACRGEAPQARSESDAVASPGPVEGGTVGDVCRDALLAFETGGADNPLVSLSYRYGQAQSFDVAESGALTGIYPALLSVPLGEETGDPGILDADIVFSFVRKNGAEFTLRFVTQDYFALYEKANAGWKYYKVSDPGLVSFCQDAAMAANAEAGLPERPVFGDMPALDVTQDVCDSLDLDGDGQNDTLYFDFIDNGDEALGALELSVVAAGTTMQTSFYPASKETVFACGVPYTPGRSLLMIATDAEAGWPSTLVFLTVEDGRLMQYKLEDVEITGFDDGVFTLSDQRTFDVSGMAFEPVE